MIQYRPLFLARKIFSGAIFRIRTKDKIVCLTFDDGPHPESTLKILDVLGKYQVRAIFFLTGSNAEKYPELKDKIITRGHEIGNHGYSHISGWSTTVKKYAENVLKAEKFISSQFFRPPYGRICPNQYHKLISAYKIVFWDLMPYDFLKSQTGEKCLRILKEKMRPGSVIVLHDKPDSQVTEFLDEFIVFALDEDYKFVTLN